jgi:hypothetical protein
MHNEDNMKIMFDYIDNNGVDPSLSAQNDPRNRVNPWLSAQNDARNGVDPLSAQNDTRDGVDLSLSAQNDHKNGVDQSPLAADGLLSPPDSSMNGLPLPIYVWCTIHSRQPSEWFAIHSRQPHAWYG